MRTVSSLSDKEKQDIKERLTFHLLWAKVTWLILAMLVALKVIIPVLWVPALIANTGLLYSLWYQLDLIEKSQK